MNKKIIASVIVILIIAGAIFLIKNSSAKTGNIIKQPEKEIKEFTIKAFKFGYTPDSITINKGDKVKIIIDNTDVLHGMRIPDLNLKGNEFIEFIADKTGDFLWYCTNMCGEGHRDMKGKLIVK